jgi:hypothetical protein
VGYDVPGGITPSTIKGFKKRQRCLDLSLSLSLSDFGRETFTFRINAYKEILRVIADLD